MTAGIEAISEREAAIVALESSIHEAIAKKDALASEIADFEAFSIASAQRDIDDLQADIRKMEESHAAETRKGARFGDKLGEIKAMLCDPLIFWKYLSGDQRRLRAQAISLQEEIDRSKNWSATHLADIQKAKGELALAEYRLRQHRGTDIEKLRCELSDVCALSSRSEVDLADLRSDLEALRGKLSAHADIRDALQAEISQNDRDILLAKKYCAALNDASDNARARRDIHKQCEDYFEDRKPNKVLERLSSKRLRLAKDLQKIDRRISDDVRRHEMDISTIIIDGNNACYSASNEFIGLSGVRRLAQHLCQKFNVTVVFDASIRALLKASTQDIQKNLGRGVTTYVAPSKNAADEYILKLAEGDDRTYVLTNDRYSEWYDYDAVRWSRAINFLISSDKFIVNDLGISLDL